MSSLLKQYGELGIGLKFNSLSKGGKTVADKTMDG
jgi:hypothetical protein